MTIDGLAQFVGYVVLVVTGGALLVGIVFGIINAIRRLVEAKEAAEKQVSYLTEEKKNLTNELADLRDQLWGESREKERQLAVLRKALGKVEAGLTIDVDAQTLKTWTVRDWLTFISEADGKLRQIAARALEEAFPPQPVKTEDQPQV